MAIKSVNSVSTKKSIISTFKAKIQNTVSGVLVDDPPEVIYGPPPADLVEEFDFEINNDTKIDIEKAQEIVEKYEGCEISKLSHDDFIEYIGAAAQLAYFEDGILPSVTIAQAILESGWGKASIGNNLFGIKVSKDWDGKTIEVVTHEEDEDGNSHKIVAEFKDYDSIIEGIGDHNELLNKDLYKPVKKACDNNDPFEACRQLQECGYATDHEYADTLISIIKSNDLTRFDP